MMYILIKHFRRPEGTVIVEILVQQANEPMHQISGTFPCLLKSINTCDLAQGHFSMEIVKYAEHLLLIM